MSQCWDFGYSDNHVTMWLMLLGEMIAGCGWLPAVIMQPHQNHEVLMPGRAHAAGRITASRLFLTARPCDATTQPSPNTDGRLWGLTHCCVTVHSSKYTHRDTWASTNQSSCPHLNIIWQTHKHWYITTNTQTCRNTHWEIKSNNFRWKVSHNIYSTGLLPNK